VSELSRLGISLHVYNEVGRIERCLESLINQDYDFTCVIFDNVSNDGTYEIIKREIRGDSRFLLFRQNFHVNQMQNFSSCIRTLFEICAETDYIMHFAADDQLLEPTYLSTMMSHINSGTAIDILAPKMRLANARTGQSKDIILKNDSHFGTFRVLRLSLSRSDSGKYNFVSALMSKRAFETWFAKYHACSIFDRQELNSRAINSEFIAMFQLLKDFRVESCCEVTYLKEIHNRDGLIKRVIPDSYEIPRRTLIELLNHQINSFMIPLRSRSIAKKMLSRYDRALFFVFGNIYFLSHVIQLTLSITSSRFLLTRSTFKRFSSRVKKH
jgi:glycosyltransferase involved in cell wall biosynthesis